MNIPTFFEAAVQSATVCYKAGLSANEDFVILVQSYAAQLQTMDNDMDDLSCKERMRLINELYERSTAILEGGKV